ncbi:MAG: hypothetical protein AAGC53_09820 [Actinomycetota bacterium]
MTDPSTTRMDMKVTSLSRHDFFELVRNSPDEFMERIHSPETFVIKRFIEPELALRIRQTAFDSGLASEPSWHPLVEGCPDYHRVHDNYEKAYVKTRMHTFYYHGYYPQNDELFELMQDIFDLKSRMGGYAEGAFRRTTPSDGVVSRVLMHNYWRGGGYQSEHEDPTSEFALVQTLIQASRPGVDYRSGGLYVRLEESGEKFYVDPHTELGDLMVLSPGIRHGVEPVDPDVVDGDWRSNDGRWVIMPIIIHSDEAKNAERPLQVGS